MKRNGIPFAARLGAAMFTGDQKRFNREICSCLQEVSEELLPVMNGRPKSDLPFVAAAMMLAANSLRMVMSEDEQSVMDSLVKDSQALVISLSELSKQMGGVTNHETA